MRKVPFSESPSISRKRQALLHGLLVLTLVLISCDVSTLLSPEPAVTVAPPGAINTIVVETAQAAATQTAANIPPTLTPTFTPLPTRTPTITPSPSPTFIFVLSTVTRVANTSTPGPASKDFACSLTGQSPTDGTTMSKNQTFPVTWTVQNTGGASWDSSSVDFKYASGAKLSPLKAVDLPKTVPPGDSITLKLTMVAPGAADSYKTVWTLSDGKDTFCRLDLTIVVK